MKNFFILVFLLVSYTGFSQIQATLKPGSVPNSVYVAIKSATTISAAKFSTFQFTIAIPSSVTPALTATVTSLDTYMGYPLPLVTPAEMQAGSSYTTYIFSGDGNQSSPGTTFAAGVENNYAEVFFTGGNVVISDLRLMQLPNGGATGQANFYVADQGTDVTNTVAQFYSNVPTSVTNDGNNYMGSSFVTIGNVVVPVKFLNFNVIKKDNAAILSWSVENETSLADHYEIERSSNGVDFKSIATIAIKGNGSSSNTYTATDAGLSTIRNNGILYYRIKQFDKDGKFIPTPIKNVRLDSKGLVIGVYPNPVKNFANVTLDLVQDADVKVTINDASGKQVQTMPMQLFKGLNIKQVNMSSLPAGSYMMNVNTGTEVKTIPVVKVN